MDHLDIEAHKHHDGGDSTKVNPCSDTTKGKFTAFGKDADIDDGECGVLFYEIEAHKTAKTSHNHPSGVGALLEKRGTKGDTDDGRGVDKATAEVKGFALGVTPFVTKASHGNAPSEQAHRDS